MDMRSQTTGNALKGRSAHAGGAEECLWGYGVSTAVGLIYGAYIAEVFRAGIEFVTSSQSEAGMSFGLNRFQVFRFVVWPQAIKNVLPALGNDPIALLKDSSLVSILAVRELTEMSKLWTGSSFQFFEGS